MVPNFCPLIWKVAAVFLRVQRSGPDLRLPFSSRAPLFVEYQESSEDSSVHLLRHYVDPLWVTVTPVYISSRGEDLLPRGTCLDGREPNDLLTVGTFDPPLVLAPPRFCKHEKKTPQPHPPGASLCHVQPAANY